ncbi:MAG TPA: biopolymer transporter ExbD [Candidatus Krumholzibacteria bacterium]|jgi:biopolymer transport protein ExbD|nr:biopolymer transporter ExbD [Candidatus Krumholzibacteria bacterium]
MRRAPGRFHARHKPLARIPTESLADIAFLLLIFYLTSALIRPEQGLHLDLPWATNTMRQPREQIAHIWIDADGRVMINDLYVAVAEIAPILGRKLRESPNLIVALNSDRRTHYRYVQRVLDEMKKAEAVRVSFTARPRGPGS